MKTYNEVITAIANKLASSQFHSYMGGGNDYYSSVDGSADVIALTFNRNTKATKHGLQNRVNAQFKRLLAKQRKAAKKYELEHLIKNPA